MKYKVALRRTEEGYAVSVPGLPGCWSEGRTEAEARVLLQDARAVQEAGAFSVVLEIVAAETTRQITEALEIPTIGIGSGESCDGQILVTHDLIGLFPWFTPKFVKPEADVAGEIRKAADAFIERTQAHLGVSDQAS